jgi:hypothetical protein
MVYSIDGKNWNRASGLSFTVGGGGGSTIAYNGTIWVAGGNGSYQLLWSSDGITWENQTGTNHFVNGSTQGVSWNGSMWTAVGCNNVSGVDNGNINILWSTDGKNWYIQDNASNWTGGRGIDVAWNGSIGVGVGHPITANGNQILVSTTGKVWNNNRSTNLIYPAMCVATDGTMWVAVGYGSNQLIWSSSATLDTGWSIEESTTKFFAGGGGLAVAYGKYVPYYVSKNGIDWKASVTLPILDTSLNKIINKNISNRYLLINRDIYDFSNNIYIDASAIVQPILPNVDNSLSFVGTNNLGFELSKNTDTNVNYTIRINNSALVDWSYCKVEYYTA